MSIFPFFQVSFFRFHFAFQGSTPIGAIFELLTVGEHPLGVICIIVFIIKLFCCPVGTGSMLDFKVKQSFYATWKGSMASHSHVLVLSWPLTFCHLFGGLVPAPDGWPWSSGACDMTAREVNQTKKPGLTKSMKSWLFNRDPYNSCPITPPYNWVVCHPLYPQQPFVEVIL